MRMWPKNGTAGKYIVVLQYVWMQIQMQMQQVDWLFVCSLLFYAIAAVFQLYHGGDMIYKMRRRKPGPTLLPTQGIFNLPHHVGMVWEQLAFDDAVSYTQRGNGLQQS